MYHTDDDTTALEETYTLPPMVCQPALQTRALLFRPGAGQGRSSMDARQPHSAKV